MSSEQVKETHKRVKTKLAKLNQRESTDTDDVLELTLEEITAISGSLRSEEDREYSLDKALKYQNDEVVHRFTTLWDVSVAETQDLFLETKKWIWLYAQPEKPRLKITTPLLMIDEMWHNFILFSRDYMKYCYDCFGRYIHHAPIPHSEKKEEQKQDKVDPIGAAAKRMQEQIEQYGFIYQNLGVETLLKWYVEYPERYNEEFFKQSYSHPTR